MLHDRRGLVGISRRPREWPHAAKKSSLGADRSYCDRAVPAARVAGTTTAWPGYGVKTYIRVSAPLVALTHVRVIDGTGSAPL